MNSRSSNPIIQAIRDTKGADRDKVRAELFRAYKYFPKIGEEAKDENDENAATPLIIAVKEENKYAVEWLLEKDKEVRSIINKGVQINLQDRSHRTALMYAVAYQDHLRITDKKEDKNYSPKNSNDVTSDSMPQTTIENTNSNNSNNTMPDNPAQTVKDKNNVGEKKDPNDSLSQQNKREIVELLLNSGANPWVTEIMSNYFRTGYIYGVYNSVYIALKHNNFYFLDLFFTQHYALPTGGSKKMMEPENQYREFISRLLYFSAIEDQNIELLNYLTNYINIKDCASEMKIKHNSREVIAASERVFDKLTCNRGWNLYTLFLNTIRNLQNSKITALLLDKIYNNYPIMLEADPLCVTADKNILTYLFELYHKHFFDKPKLYEFIELFSKCNLQPIEDHFLTILQIESNSEERLKLFKILVNSCKHALAYKTIPFNCDRLIERLVKQKENTLIIYLVNVGIPINNAYQIQFYPYHSDYSKSVETAISFGNIEIVKLLISKDAILIKSIKEINKSEEADEKEWNRVKSYIEMIEAFVKVAQVAHPSYGEQSEIAIQAAQKLFELVHPDDKQDILIYCLKKHPHLGSIFIKHFPQIIPILSLEQKNIAPDKTSAANEITVPTLLQPSAPPLQGRNSESKTVSNELKISGVNGLPQEGMPQQETEPGESPTEGQPISSKLNSESSPLFFSQTQKSPQSITDNDATTANLEKLDKSGILEYEKIQAEQLLAMTRSSRFWRGKEDLRQQLILHADSILTEKNNPSFPAKN